MQRWPDVNLLQMRLRHMHAANRLLMRRLIRGARHLEKLVGLQLICLDEDDGRWDGRLQDAQLVSAILKSASSLRVLQLRCRLPKLTAPLGSLHHIILQAGTRQPGAAFSCLAGAKSLKTLRIAMHPRCQELSMSPEGIDLSLLSNLTAVSLHLVVPEALSLPDGCDLSVSLLQFADASNQVRETVKEHIKEFRISDEDHSILSVMDLPQVLRTAPAPELVEITCLQIGTSRAQLLLDAALASVRWLRLETFAGGLHVCVPEVTAWESLLLHAHEGSPGHTI